MPNKASQIFEVVNVVLYYQTHERETLLTVSSLEKQDLILRLKQHNSEVNQQKNQVLIAYCPTCCLKCQETRKTKKLKICIQDICYSISISKDKESFPNMPIKYRKKLDYCIFMIQLTSKHPILDLHTVTIYSLRLSTVYRQVQIIERTNQILSPYIQKFESVFAKNNFDILSKHYHYNHTIELTL